MQMHRDAAYQIPTEGVPADVLEQAHRVSDEALELGREHGYRNAQISLLAPTGTISFMMDCDTTGIEPDLALVKYKKLVGEGFIKIVNHTVPHALKKLGYSADEVEAIFDHINERETIEGAPGLKPEHLSVFDCAFKPVNGERSIQYMGHVRMMGAVQPFLSGAISKTVNMPEAATAEEIEHGLPRGLEAGPEGHRDLPRRQQAQPAALHRQEEGRGQRSTGCRNRRAADAARVRPRPRRASRIVAGSRPSGPRSPTSSTSPATRATSPSASTRTASPARSS